MTNQEKFKEILNSYLEDNGVKVPFLSDFHKSSFSQDGDKSLFLYGGTKDYEVISMDDIASMGFRRICGIDDINVVLNTVDAFIIDKNNIWYFIEFKSGSIKNCKHNVEKKGYANWLMLMEILFSSKGKPYPELFDFDDPMKFAKNHFVYILVCGETDNSRIVSKIRDYKKLGEDYTPECMQKFKEYFFYNAYVLTENMFEECFLKKLVV